MTRLEANREILKKISEFIEKYPDQRFGQALVNLELVRKQSILFTDSIFDPKGWDDEYNTESACLLERMKTYGQD